MTLTPVQGHPHPQGLVFARVLYTQIAPGNPGNLHQTSYRLRGVLQRVERHDSQVSNRELEAWSMHQSPRALDSTPSIEEYASEVRALKLRRSPPTLDSTHGSEECAHATANSETASEIITEKPKKEWVPWVYRPVRFDILEALIGHSHGYSNPVQHKLDAQEFWESGKKFVAAEASESLASPTENLAQGEASTKEITENGHCYACKNQGMHALQHPILGIGYEGGHAAMGPPFVYLSDDDYFD
ncbi:hypothetical protein ACQ4PT_064145 [Festuca glaucescens]